MSIVSVVLRIIKKKLFFFQLRLDQMWKLDGTTLTNQAKIWRSPGAWIFRETSPQNYNIINMKVRYSIFKNSRFLHIRQNNSTFLPNSTKNSLNKLCIYVVQLKCQVKRTTNQKFGSEKRYQISIFMI